MGASELWAPSLTLHLLYPSHFNPTNLLPYFSFSSNPSSLSQLIFMISQLGPCNSLLIIISASNFACIWAWMLVLKCQPDHDVFSKFDSSTWPILGLISLFFISIGNYRVNLVERMHFSKWVLITTFLPELCPSSFFIWQFLLELPYSL